MTSILFYGGGGHARVLLDTLLLDHTPSDLAVLDNDLGKRGSELYGVAVEGDDSCAAELVARGATLFVVAMGGPGQAWLRERIYGQAIQLGLRPHTVRHPSNLCSARAAVAEGVQLLAATVVNAGARLETNVIVNTGAIVEHDCVLEAHAHIAPGATLCGGVHVGRRAHVGAGAVVKQGIRIGSDAVVGAGAVVVKDVLPNCTVAGVPARVLRKAVA